MNKKNLVGFSNNQEEYYDLTRPNKTKASQKDSFYFLSNDIVKINKNTFSNDESVFVGVANPHLLSVLYLCYHYSSIRRIIAFDYSLNQLKHLKNIVNLILHSSNRIEFLEKLFYIRISKEGKRLLKAYKTKSRNLYVHGCVEADNKIDLEKKLWKEISFNEDKFNKEYNLKAKKTEKGLLVTNTITAGGIKNYFLTILSCSQKNFDKTSFTIAFGTSYLTSENDFNLFKELLKRTPIYYLQGNASKIVPQIIKSNSYLPINLWMSNLFDEYFIEKFPGLSKLFKTIKDWGTNQEPSFPEIDINLIQDKRIKSYSVPEEMSSDKKRQRNLSNHTLSFKKVSKYLDGEKTLEIVNVKRWIKENHGESKLYNTEYISWEDFKNKLKNNKLKEVKTFFFHILIGHGVSSREIKEVCSKHLSNLNSKKLIILEHFNKDEKVNVSLNELRNVYGKEDKVELCKGKNSEYRNILALHNSKINFKIAFLTPEFVTEKNWDGGLANYLDRITNNLIQLGNEVHVITLSNRNETIMDNNRYIHRFEINNKLYSFLNKITFHKISTSLKNIFIALSVKKMFRKKNRKFNFDFVQTTSYLVPHLFISTKIPDPPFIQRFSSITKLYNKAYKTINPIDLFFVNLFEKLGTKKVNYNYAPSSYTAKLAHELFNCEIGSLLPPKKKINDKKNNSKLPKNLTNKKYFVFYGTIGSLKGIKIFEKIIYKVLQNYPDINFVFIGKKIPINGKDPEVLIKESSKEHFDRVFFYQRMVHSQLFPIIKKAHAVILPSKYDNLPNTLIESLSLGKLVITTKQAGALDILSDSKKLKEFIFDYDSPQSENKFYKIISGVISLSNERVNELGRLSKKQINKKMNAEKQTKKIIKIFNEVKKSYYS